MQSDVAIAVEPGVHLGGSLTVPAVARGIVLFAHGSGSSRFSPRNRFVAEAFNEAGLATLLMDLLTGEEEIAEQTTRHLRFDIGLLARRLEAAIDWVRAEHALPVGLFGASTGAAAALIAAAGRPDLVRAVVSRGGRPDLAGDALRRVQAPTLLIVGGADPDVLELNRHAMAMMTAPVSLRIVAAATHLFEEPGALETVAEWATEWFTLHLELAVFNHRVQREGPRRHR